MTGAETVMILSRLTEGFFLRQVLLIAALFLLGSVFLYLVRDRMEPLWRFLLAYPAGLSLTALTGFGMLAVGIPYNAFSLTGVLALILAALFVISLRSRAGHSSRGGDSGKTPKAPGTGKYLHLAAAALLVTAGAVLSCSGILGAAVSNDSVYYYSVFPSILAKKQAYTPAMDLFLTNAGQTTAVINTLPFLFGFDQSFGIQHFLNLNFVLLFFCSCKEAAEHFLSDGASPEDPDASGGISREVRRKAGFAAVFPSLLLLTSEPFLVTAKWILSNAYFMEYLFLLLFLGYRESFSAEEGQGKDFYALQALFTAMLALLRVEGGVIAAVFIFCLSLQPVPRKRLCLTWILPLFLSEALYCALLYIRIGADPLYGFLDWKKALVLLAFPAAAAFYALFVRPRLPGEGTGDYLPLALISLLAVGNLGIGVISRSRYFTNLYAFYQNIRQGRGWGSFWILFLLLFLLSGLQIISSRGKRLPFPGTCALALILTVIAVCWARGGVLAVRVSDSGNRAMMQLAPVVVFALFEGALRLLSRQIREY